MNPYKDLPQQAISLRQPWAKAVMYQGKDVENRTRRTHFRGTICVHASQVRDTKSFKLYQAIAEKLHIEPYAYGDCHYGGIVGTVDIVDCVEHSNSAWWMGPWGWVLANPKPLDQPIAVAGQLGVFNWRNNLTSSALIQAT